MRARKLWLMLIVCLMAGSLLTACQPTTVEVAKVVEKPVPQTVEVEKVVEKPVVQTVEVEKVVQATVQVEKVVEKGGMRQLKGKITVATEGAVPVPGMPVTAKQQAWQTLLSQYKQLQPNVEVALEDLPQGQTGEQWCDARKTANTMPDISMVGECNYFAPNPGEIADGTAIATDFKKFEDETNPYTGRPWKADWANDYLRLSRCNLGGAYGTWTCQTEQVWVNALYANWDVLKQYGYEKMPATLGELWQLCDKINKDGKYQCFDSPRGAYNMFVWSIGTSLAMDLMPQFKSEDQYNNKLFQDDNSGFSRVQNMCNKKWWGEGHAGYVEAAQQIKRYVDVYSKGGVAEFLDPARDETGIAWRAGKAAFRFSGTNEYGLIEAAKKDGTFLVNNWTLEGWPKLTQADLFNKDAKVFYDGQIWMFTSGSGDIFAPIGKVRASKDDPNVDLIVRDFFQFLSSPTGQTRVLTMGGLPVNPITLSQADPGLQQALQLRPKVYGDFSNTPGGFIGFAMTPSFDAADHFGAWLRGETKDPVETVLQKANEAATIENLKRHVEYLRRMGDDSGKQVPPECQPWLDKVK